MSSVKKRLAKGRKIRHQIGLDFLALQEGRLSIADVIQTPTYALKRVDVYDALRRTPKLGPEGARKVCTGAGVWPHITLGNLTRRQREALVRNLPQRAYPSP
jgi:hypothetical protein